MSNSRSSRRPSRAAVQSPRLPAFANHPLFVGLQKSVDELRNLTINRGLNDLNARIAPSLAAAQDAGAERAVAGLGSPAGNRLAPPVPTERLGDAMLKDLENIYHRLEKAGYRSEQIADRLLGVEPSPPGGVGAAPEPGCIVGKFDAAVSMIRSRLSFLENHLDRLERL